jgi:hypothetical protein
MAKSDPRPDQLGTTLSEGAVGCFDILSTERRRLALQTLMHTDGKMTLSGLAEEIAAIQNGKAPEELSAKERKAVYITLYQDHIPRMVDAEIIDHYGEDGEAHVLELRDTATAQTATELMRVVSGSGKQSSGGGVLSRFRSLLPGVGRA